jgi:hypothetical protein
VRAPRVLSESSRPPSRDFFVICCRWGDFSSLRRHSDLIAPCGCLNGYSFAILSRKFFLSFPFRSRCMRTSVAVKFRAWLERQY